MWKFNGPVMAFQFTAATVNYIADAPVSNMVPPSIGNPPRIVPVKYPLCASAIIRDISIRLYLTDGNTFIVPAGQSYDVKLLINGVEKLPFSTTFSPTQLTFRTINTVDVPVNVNSTLDIQITVNLDPVFQGTVTICFASVTIGMYPL